MIRRALIIYCNNTRSGKLAGPSQDNQNFREYLTSSLGGYWYDEEILSLPNPSSIKIYEAINSFLNGADYTFVIFTGHGFIDIDNNMQQNIELSDKRIPISKLRTNAKRQTLIIDACRGYFSSFRILSKAFGDISDSFIIKENTRKMFDYSVLNAEEGLTILYAASENQTALDTNVGAAYLLSLLEVAKNWKEYDIQYNILPLNVAHEHAQDYLSENFETIQIPSKNSEKRRNYFPFAVKMSELNG